MYLQVLTLEGASLKSYKIGTKNKLSLDFQLSETTWCLTDFHGNNSHLMASPVVAILNF